MQSGGGSVSAEQPDEPGESEGEASERFDDSRGPHPAILLAVFVAVAVGLTFPNVTRLRTSIAGDSGDSLLNLWIIRRVQIGLPHGWHAFWNPPIYYPTKATLAYSDTLLPVALVEWPLRLILGDVLALNVIYLGSWVLSSWSTYRLARRFVRFWGAAFVASLAYTYAATRLIHQQHFQLVVGGALVPLIVLLALRVFDKPTIGRGLLLGLTFAAVALSASYFGALAAVMLVIVAGGLMIARHHALRRYVVAFVAAAAVVVVLVGPPAVKYWQLQQHPEFRRSFNPENAMHLSDFAATGEHNYLLDHVPLIHRDSRPGSRGIENRLFPGLVVLAFGAVGALAAASRGRRRRRREPAGSVEKGSLEFALVIAAGATALVLSFGDWIRLGGHRVYLPFALFRRVVPGFAGIRAVPRLELGFQLALALLAALGIDVTLRRCSPPWRTVIAIALAGVVVAESAMSLLFVKVPTSADDGGVDTALRARPPGLVVELPMHSFNDGVLWPYSEAPRQLLALRDHDPRVNGYSGFQPGGLDRKARTLDHFPAADALSLARELGVRYVVLRTRLVGQVSGSPGAVAAVEKDGAGLYDARTAAKMVSSLPPGAAVAAVELPGGYLIELTGKP